MSFCRIFHSIFSAITFFLYEASVTVTDHSVNTAGRVYILEYSVGGMNQSVIYQWLDREGSPITTGNSISIGFSTSASFLYFSPLHQSHEGNYTCSASTTEAMESKPFYVSVKGIITIIILTCTDLL